MESHPLILSYTIVMVLESSKRACAGVDNIKVNFHRDNIPIVDRIIDVIAPLTNTLHA